MYTFKKAVKTWLKLFWSLADLLSQFSSVQFSSVTQSCLTLCNPMDCSTPGLPIYHQLPEFTQTHVHWVSMPSNHPSSVIPFSSCLQSFPASGSFPMNQFFTSGGQSIKVSASASVLPMNIQDSQESSPTPQFKSINSSVFSFLHSPTLTSIHDYWKNQSLD